MQDCNIERGQALPVIRGILDALRIERVLFALDKPVLPGVFVNPNVRLIAALPGRRYRIRAAVNGEVRRLELADGDLLCCLPGSGVERLDMRTLDSISAVFLPHCIRFTYGDAVRDDRIGIWHSSRALSPGGHLLLRGLLSFARENRDRALLAGTARTVFATLRDDLERDAPGESKAVQTRMQALRLMQKRFQHRISRDEIAAQLRITPTHLSRLLSSGDTGGFTETLSRIRLEYAVELLCESGMSLDEIALNAGFQSTSYFIRVFKVRYGVTPARFRERGISVPPNQGGD